MVLPEAPGRLVTVLIILAVVLVAGLAVIVVASLRFTQRLMDREYADAHPLADRDFAERRKKIIEGIKQGELQIIEGYPGIGETMLIRLTHLTTMGRL